MLMPFHRGKHVEPMLSPMRRGTKRSINLDEAADDDTGEEDSDADEQEEYGEMVMDDLGVEMETDVHVGVNLGSEEWGGHTEKDGQTGGGRARAVQAGRTKNCHGDPLQKKGKIRESTSTRTLPAKQTKYVPRSAYASSTTASTSNMTTNAAMNTVTKARNRLGAGGGKTVGASHLTQLRKAH
ncbi:hypothetical protein PISMIDRAFT_533087 [Pisolithus microcarpus 441]|uniref:Uncharacterized protein n=1 Tax=Pisolithus microcarpus 441 TaxID=765257 RepID=A0A0C9YT86_9AGAM|nr:hypothetical protein BKA83DRAFT_533087 [Pisolithus microcarpus]KIK11098.1 hypothetical protein PISMIDRAFT_533087 [Pisolithus microcarpus 441]